MKYSLFYVCLVLFVLCEVKTLKAPYNLHRLIRAVNGRAPNASLYNTDPNWKNHKQSNDNWSQLNNQWGYNDDRSSQGYPNNNSTQNTYGYSSNPNGYATKPPGWNGTGLQWNNPDGRYAQGHPNLNIQQPQNGYGYNSDQNGYAARPPRWNGTGQQWNTNGGYYNQENHQRKVGWQPEPQSGYNSHNPGGNYHQGNLNNPSYPTQIGSRPPNSSQHATNAYGYNTPTQGNYLGGQHYTAPNDLMIHNYKRSIDHRHYNKSMYNIDPGWHADKNPLWHNTNSHWNDTGRNNLYQRNSSSFNNTSSYDRFQNRFRRSMHHQFKRSQNISWYNVDAQRYNITPPDLNGNDWNKPGGHYYTWNVNNQGTLQYHHRHRFAPPPPPPQNGPPPPQNRPPPQYDYQEPEQTHPRHHSRHRFALPPPPPPPQYEPSRQYGPPNFGPGGRPSSNYPIDYNTPWRPAIGSNTAVPETGLGLNGTAINEASTTWKPELEKSTTTVNGTDVWGPEIPDLKDSGENNEPPVTQ